MNTAKSYDSVATIEISISHR